jgi:hypothetical protein
VRKSFIRPFYSIEVSSATISVEIRNPSSPPLNLRGGREGLVSHSGMVETPLAFGRSKGIAIGLEIRTIKY